MTPQLEAIQPEDLSAPEPDEADFVAPANYERPRLLRVAAWMFGAVVVAFVGVLSLAFAGRP